MTSKLPVEAYIGILGAAICVVIALISLYKSRKNNTPDRSFAWLFVALVYFMIYISGLERSLVYIKYLTQQQPSAAELIQEFEQEHLNKERTSSMLG